MTMRRSAGHKDDEASKAFNPENIHAVQNVTPITVSMSTEILLTMFKIQLKYFKVFFI